MTYSQLLKKIDTIRDKNISKRLKDWTNKNKNQLEKAKSPMINFELVSHFIENINKGKVHNDQVQFMFEQFEEQQKLLKIISEVEEASKKESEHIVIYLLKNQNEFAKIIDNEESDDYLKKILIESDTPKDIIELALSKRSEGEIDDIAIEILIKSYNALELDEDELDEGLEGLIYHGIEYAIEIGAHTCLDEILEAAEDITKKDTEEDANIEGEEDEQLNFEGILSDNEIEGLLIKLCKTDLDTSYPIDKVIETLLLKYHTKEKSEKSKVGKIQRLANKLFAISIVTNNEEVNASLRELIKNFELPIISQTEFHQLKIPKDIAEQFTGVDIEMHLQELITTGEYKPGSRKREELDKAIKDTSDTPTDQKRKERLKQFTISELISTKYKKMRMELYTKKFLSALKVNDRMQMEGILKTMKKLKLDRARFKMPSEKDIHEINSANLSEYLDFLSKENKKDKKEKEFIKAIKNSNFKLIRGIITEVNSLNLSGTALDDYQTSKFIIVNEENIEEFIEHIQKVNCRKKLEESFVEAIKTCNFKNMHEIIAKEKSLELNGKLLADYATSKFTIITKNNIEEYINHIRNINSLKDAIEKNHFSEMETMITELETKGCAESITLKSISNDEDAEEDDDEEDEAEFEISQEGFKEYIKEQVKSYGGLLLKQALLEDRMDDARLLAKHGAEIFPDPESYLDVEKFDSEINAKNINNYLEQLNKKRKGESRKYSGLFNKIKFSRKLELRSKLVDMIQNSCDIENDTSLEPRELVQSLIKSYKETHNYDYFIFALSIAIKPRSKIIHGDERLVTNDTELLNSIATTCLDDIDFDFNQAPGIPFFNTAGLMMLGGVKPDSLGQLIKDSKLQANHTGENNFNPLHIAIKLDSLDYVKMLLAQRDLTDLTSIDQTQKTPLGLALSMNDDNVNIRAIRSKLIAILKVRGIPPTEALTKEEIEKLQKLYNNHELFLEEEVEDYLKDMLNIKPKQKISSQKSAKKHTEKREPEPLEAAIQSGNRQEIDNLLKSRDTTISSYVLDAAVKSKESDTIISKIINSQLITEQNMLLLVKHALENKKDNIHDLIKKNKNFKSFLKSDYFVDIYVEHMITHSQHKSCFDLIDNNNLGDKVIIKTCELLGDITKQMLGEDEESDKVKTLEKYRGPILESFKLFFEKHKSHIQDQSAIETAIITACDKSLYDKYTKEFGKSTKLDSEAIKGAIYFQDIDFFKEVYSKVDNIADIHELLNHLWELHTESQREIEDYNDDFDFLEMTEFIIEQNPELLVYAVENNIAPEYTLNRILDNGGVDGVKDLNSLRDSANNTLLHKLFQSKIDEDITSKLEQLIKLGCNVHAVNEDFETPLYLACENSDIDSILLLLSHGATLDLFNHDEEYNPISALIDSYKSRLTSEISEDVQNCIASLSIIMDILSTEHHDKSTKEKLIAFISKEFLNQNSCFNETYKLPKDGKELLISGLNQSNPGDEENVKLAAELIFSPKDTFQLTNESLLNFPEFSDDNGNTLLHKICEAQNYELLKKILTAKPDPSSNLFSKSTKIRALVHAENNDRETVKSILEEQLEEYEEESDELDISVKSEIEYLLLLIDIDPKSMNLRQVQDIRKKIKKVPGDLLIQLDEIEETLSQEKQKLEKAIESLKSEIKKVKGKAQQPLKRKLLQSEKELATIVGEDSESESLAISNPEKLMRDFQSNHAPISEIEIDVISNYLIHFNINENETSKHKLTSKNSIDQVSLLMTETESYIHALQKTKAKGNLSKATSFEISMKNAIEKYKQLQIIHKQVITARQDLVLNKLERTLSNKSKSFPEELMLDIMHVEDYDKIDFSDKLISEIQSSKDFDTAFDRALTKHQFISRDKLYIDAYQERLRELLLSSIPRRLSPSTKQLISLLSTSTGQSFQQIIIEHDLVTFSIQNGNIDVIEMFLNEMDDIKYLSANISGLIDIALSQHHTAKLSTLLKLVENKIEPNLLYDKLITLKDIPTLHEANVNNAIVRCTLHLIENATKDSTLLDKHKIFEKALKHLDSGNAEHLKSFQGMLVQMDQSYLSKNSMKLIVQTFNHKGQIKTEMLFKRLLETVPPQDLYHILNTIDYQSQSESNKILISSTRSICVEKLVKQRTDIDMELFTMIFNHGTFGPFVELLDKSEPEFIHINIDAMLSTALSSKNPEKVKRLLRALKVNKNVDNITLNSALNKIDNVDPLHKEYVDKFKDNLWKVIIREQLIKNINAMTFNEKEPRSNNVKAKALKNGLCHAVRNKTFMDVQGVKIYAQYNVNTEVDIQIIEDAFRIKDPISEEDIQLSKEFQEEFKATMEMVRKISKHTSKKSSHEKGSKAVVTIKGKESVDKLRTKYLEKVSAVNSSSSKNTTAKDLSKKDPCITITKGSVKQLKSQYEAACALETSKSAIKTGMSQDRFIELVSKFNPNSIAKVEKTPTDAIKNFGITQTLAERIDAYRQNCDNQNMIQNIHDKPKNDPSQRKG